MRRNFHRLLFAAFTIALFTAPSLGVLRAQSPDCLKPDTPGCTFGLPSFQYQLLLGEMTAHPSPNVHPLEVDMTEIKAYAFFRVVGGTITLYDAPNGNPNGTLDAGFNYVTIRKRDGEWVEIGAGSWTQAKNLVGTQASTYSGVMISEPLAYPMAWVLLDTRPSQIPGIQPDKTIPIMVRYTRLNIFYTVKVGDWEWYLVGPGQWLEQRRIARVLPAAKPDGVKGRWVAVDLYEQVLVAYEDDRMVFTTLISSGLEKWSTNQGLFHIWARARADTMSGAMGQPDFYYLQAVPYVMYFDDAISLHGTYWHDGFGYRHSHGCVNMSITDAHWIFDWTDNFYFDMTVDIWSSGSY